MASAHCKTQYESSPLCNTHQRLFVTIGMSYFIFFIRKAQKRLYVCYFTEQYFLVLKRNKTHNTNETNLVWAVLLGVFFLFLVGEIMGSVPKVERYTCNAI